MREYPKFSVIRFFAVFRKILLQMGEDLVQAGRLDRPEDILFLALSLHAPAQRTSQQGSPQVLHAWLTFFGRREIWKEWRNCMTGVSPSGWEGRGEA